MDLTPQIPRLQTRSKQGHSLLRASRTAIASGDRVLLASWMGWFQELGHLVAAATTEEECLQGLLKSDANLLIVRTNSRGAMAQASFDAPNRTIPASRRFCSFNAPFCAPSSKQLTRPVMGCAPIKRWEWVA